LTGAGDGCTACHHRLNELIEVAIRVSHRRELVMAEL
jgi:coenzyme F420-reducing hydrogenase gamma subunit